MTDVRVQLKTLPPLTLVKISGHTCEVVRQARRTTYVRVVQGDLTGAVVQLPRDGKVKVLA